jgi:outer membrane protein assembly factor BamE (lipoprotein component of BamABCDE complex)
MRMTIGLLFMVLTTACATVGRKFDSTHVDQIQKGVQTKAQITEWFGKPNQVTRPLTGDPGGCVESWKWTYAHATAVFGRRHTTSKALIVLFDPQDKVCRHAYSELER